jgi:hypothetical protein
MTPRRRKLEDVRAERAPKPYLADGTLDPEEWKLACSAANAIAQVVGGGQPWFVEARPIEVYGQGLELEVVVRWLSSEVYSKVPLSVDEYAVNVTLAGQTFEVHSLH